MGEKWKRFFPGRWNSKPYGSSEKGTLFWGFGIEDQGFEEFDDYEIFKEKYFEVFKRLKKD